MMVLILLLKVFYKTIKDWENNNELADLPSGLKETYKWIKQKRQIIIIFNKTINILVEIYTLIVISILPGNYCEEVIPDPIPNSEVKLFSADGTLP